MEEVGLAPPSAIPNEALCVSYVVCIAYVCVYITECTGPVMGASLYYHGYSWMSM